jgi:hypothetical protein
MAGCAFLERVLAGGEILRQGGSGGARHHGGGHQDCPHSSSSKWLLCGLVGAVHGTASPRIDDSASADGLRAIRRTMASPRRYFTDSERPIKR